MKILIACERSGRVRRAFRAKGHNAYSCDIEAADDGEKTFHIRADVTTWIGPTIHWDMMIAFPPCTDLAVSGARWFKSKQLDGSQDRSIKFFYMLATCPCIEKIAVENPVGIMSSLYAKPDQIIQPWQFGHGETKATCLWLTNLPKLKPTNIVAGREARIWKMPPGPDRAKMRSETFQGIADAMAEQWG
jgi:hypothetical protein